MQKILHLNTSSYISNRAIIAFVIELILCLFLAAATPLPLIWIVIALFTVIAFFYYFKKFTYRMQRLDDKKFRKQIFTIALFIRIIIVSFLYIFFIIKTDQPYEFMAADSLGYNDMGIYISELLIKHKFNIFDKLSFLNLSDTGYPIFLGINYTLLFNSVLLSRFIQAIFSAWTCVLVYDISKRNFNEQIARISGVLMMLMPSLIYYCGLHLKETIMIFILIAFVNYADKLLRVKKLKILSVTFLVILAGLLFLFRTVLAVSAVFAFFTALLFISKRITGWSKKIVITFWFIIGFFSVISPAIFDEISFYLQQSETNQETQMKNFSTREAGNKLAKYGKRSVFIPMILIAPFPTLVNTGQENLMMLSGVLYIKNILIFFVLLSILNMFRRKILRNHVLILAFLAYYLLILASSGFALSERFHLPAIPFLIILTAYGMSQFSKLHTKYYTPYLVIVVIITLGWNWFKLAGRGMI